jgi:hypothetical protein
METINKKIDCERKDVSYISLSYIYERFCLVEVGASPYNPIGFTQ